MCSWAEQKKKKKKENVRNKFPWPGKTLKYSVVTTRRPHYSFKNLQRLRLPIPHGRVSPGVMWGKKRLSLKLFTFTTELHVSVPEDLTKASILSHYFHLSCTCLPQSTVCECVCVCVCVLFCYTTEHFSQAADWSCALNVFWSSCRNQGNSPQSDSPPLFFCCFFF